MRTLLFLLFISLGFPSLACDCASEVELSLEFHRTRSVVIAEVVSIKKTEDAGEYLVTIEILEDFKGKKKGERQIVRTNSSGKACGYSFIVGQQYLIYANPYMRNSAQWTTSVCSRTCSMSDAENDLIYITRETKTEMNPEWEKEFKE